MQPSSKVLFKKDYFNKNHQRLSHYKPIVQEFNHELGSGRVIELLEDVEYKFEASFKKHGNITRSYITSKDNALQKSRIEFQRMIMPTEGTKKTLERYKQFKNKVLTATLLKLEDNEYLMRVVYNFEKPDYIETLTGDYEEVLDKYKARYTHLHRGNHYFWKESLNPHLAKARKLRQNAYIAKRNKEEAVSWLLSEEKTKEYGVEKIKARIKKCQEKEERFLKEREEIINGK